MTPRTKLIASLIVGNVMVWTGGAIWTAEADAYFRVTSTGSATVVITRDLRNSSLQRQFPYIRTSRRSHGSEAQASSTVEVQQDTAGQKMTAEYDSLLNDSQHSKCCCKAQQNRSDGGRRFNLVVGPSPVAAVTHRTASKC